MSFPPVPMTHLQRRRDDTEDRARRGGEPQRRRRKSQAPRLCRIDTIAPALRGAGPSDREEFPIPGGTGYVLPMFTVKTRRSAAMPGAGAGLMQRPITERLVPRSAAIVRSTWAQAAVSYVPRRGAVHYPRAQSSAPLLPPAEEFSSRPVQAGTLP